MRGVAVFGITGRMGQTLVRALREAQSAAAAGEPPQGVLRLSGALASPGSARLGRDAALEGPASGVAVTADPETALAGAAVAIDFSLPGCVADHARACARAGVPLLVGATGLDAPSGVALEAAAGAIPVLIAPNTSIGVAVMTHLLELASAALGGQYDVEISEAHHRMKRDAPSGTALALGEVVAGVRGESLESLAVFDRHGTSEPRRHGSLGFSVVRAGDIVGEHTVTFAAAGERIELTHRATDRMIFARGALRAARWLIGRPAGLYGMRDVLGLGEELDRHRAHR
jgi:4-hydroxy-tetrahydrodipicolinate reductase